MVLRSCSRQYILLFVSSLILVGATLLSSEIASLQAESKSTKQRANQKTRHRYAPKKAQRRTGKKQRQTKSYQQSRRRQQHISAKPTHPLWVGLAAEVFPGLGYALIGEWSRATFTSALMIPLVAPHLWTAETFLQQSLKTNSWRAARNVFGFSVYDSYQRALKQPGITVRLKQHATADFTFTKMLLAPFNPRYYRRVQVWLPMSAVVVYNAYLINRYGIAKNLETNGLWYRIPLVFLQSALIGLGEESEYRGFQMPMFATLSNRRWLGNIIQSAVFGLCHTRYRICSSPWGTGNLVRQFSLIDPKREYGGSSSSDSGSLVDNLKAAGQAALFGLYAGSLTYSEGDGLLQAIAVHAFWDAILMTTSMLITGSTGRIYLSVGFPFSLM